MDFDRRSQLKKGLIALTGIVFFAPFLKAFSLPEARFPSSSGGGGGGGGNYVAKDNSNSQTMIGDLRGKDFVKGRSGTVTRDGSGYISSIALTGGRTNTYTRSSGYVTSFTDTTNTWTLTRNASNYITSWTVT